jgi:WD40 repeat protein
VRYLVIVTAIVLTLSACGAPVSRPVASGPGLAASLAASWEAAGPGRQAVFSGDGRLLATSDASGLITIRDTQNWSVQEQLRHPGGATSLAFGRDNSHLFSGGYDATVREWDLRSRKLAAVFSGPVGTVWTIDISPDGKRLAAAGEDAIIRIWNNLDARSEPEQLRGHTRNIWDVRFSPDGTRLASGSFDASVKLWDPNSGKLIKTLTGHTEAVVGLAFSPDGKSLASGADDSTVRMWRVSDARQLRVIDTGAHVDSVAFSRDGRWLASGGHARGAIGAFWHQLTGTGAPGPAVLLWRTKDGALVDALPHPDDVMSVVFSKDGRWLVTSGEDSRARLWRLKAIRS